MLFRDFLRVAVMLFGAAGTALAIVAIAGASGEDTNLPIYIRNAAGDYERAAKAYIKSFRADWLFSYQPNPGTVLFVGYGSSLAGDNYFAPSALERVNDGFFVKLSYLWRAR